MKLSSYKTHTKFLFSKKKSGGRNNKGRITVQHRGGGHKQNIRQIDWLRNSTESYVLNFEHNPGHTVPLLKIYNTDSYPSKEGLTSWNSFSYILAPKGIKIFDNLKSVKDLRKNLYLTVGDCTKLYNFETGDFVHNVEPFNAQKPIFARAAGTFCQILQQHSDKYVSLRLPSGSQRLCSNEGSATLGILSNEKHHLRILKKAGVSRHLGIRPRVRGVAMNPIDHPHGGGQGKTSGGRPSVTPQGRPTKGQPTRKKKKKNILILTPRKK